MFYYARKRKKRSTGRGWVFTASSEEIKWKVKETATNFVLTSFTLVLLLRQEMKKVQNQYVKPQESPFSSRPRTSSSRGSNRSLNSSFAYASSPLNKRISGMSQPVGSDNNSIAEETRFIRKSRSTRMRKMSGNNGHGFNVKADAASEISVTCSGPTSPWFFSPLFFFSIYKYEVSSIMILIMYVWFR